MNLQLDSDELDLAIQAYLAFRGYTSDLRIYDKDRLSGESRILCVNVKQASFDEDKVVEMIKGK